MTRSGVQTLRARLEFASATNARGRHARAAQLYRTILADLEGPTFATEPDSATRMSGRSSVWRCPGSSTRATSTALSISSRTPGCGSRPTGPRTSSSWSVGSAVCSGCAPDGSSRRSRRWMPLLDSSTWPARSMPQSSSSTGVAAPRAGQS
ncbi:hypothetical protein NKG05_05490 [Oerskovia sp. M15]